MSIASKLVLAAALAVAPVGAAFADTPGADWISMEQVTQKLKAAGYSSVAELEADDGRWEGKGVKDGRMMEFDVDPRTGAISNERLDD
ncbi:PepSY domain-containing protein [Methylopila turkensis]|uniref:PepSY domain-containing protein n=1 Tax=Methylopila turkensis TaxID=1437816 RepID=A0A9W6JKR4_9HYPH|nr:PepSY domain-containing protein [Methylopila turkensis]GLK78992.1 hypothetical protein GCM10008174_07330 [Methylopila turkensis]